MLSEKGQDDKAYLEDCLLLVHLQQARLPLLQMLPLLRLHSGNVSVDLRMHWCLSSKTLSIAQTFAILALGMLIST